MVIAIVIMVFLIIILSPFFIIGKPNVYLKSKHESEFDDIVNYLSGAHDGMSIVVADEWMEEFIMFWEEELSKEQIEHYKKIYNSIRKL
jgi:hypothetical protein